MHNLILSKKFGYATDHEYQAVRLFIQINRCQSLGAIRSVRSHKHY